MAKQPTPLMKPHHPFRNWVAGLALATTLKLCPATLGAPSPPVDWPRVIFRNGVTNTIYQPQLVSWDYSTLKAVSAVAVQAKGAPEPTFGTINLTIRTRVDRAQREVFFENVQIPQALFPSASAQAGAYLATLRSLIPKEVESISLDRIEASLCETIRR